MFIYSTYNCDTNASNIQIFQFVPISGDIIFSSHILNVYWKTK